MEAIQDLRSYERLEDLRDKAEQGLITSIEFVKELCKLAKETFQIEKEIEDEINNKSPKAALTELFQELKSGGDSSCCREDCK